MTNLVQTVFSRREIVMNERPLDVYLTDHLAGSTGGVELAQRAAEENSGSDLGSFFSELLADIQEDRATLEDMMKHLGTQPSPIKQAGAWIMEKFSRFKMAAGSQDLGTLLMIETLEMGVEGKLSLWRALNEVADGYPQLGDYDLKGLMERAEAQIAALEEQRLKAAKTALAAPASVS
jgi:hypothetical protein